MSVKLRKKKKCMLSVGAIIMPKAFSLYERVLYLEPVLICLDTLDSNNTVCFLLKHQNFK